MYKKLKEWHCRLDISNLSISKPELISSEIDEPTCKITLKDENSTVSNFYVEKVLFGILKESEELFEIEEKIINWKAAIAFGPGVFYFCNLLFYGFVLGSVRAFPI